MRVCVVVLGDIGRSPRMMYHSMSLADEGWDVDVVGYGGSSPSKKFSENPKIKVRQIAEPPLCIKRLPRLFGYGFKTIWQFFTLLFHMFSIPRPSHVLVQNPPSVPTLAAVWILSKIQRSKLIIDWHNYGYSILAITLGSQHLLVKFSRWFEFYFGRKAHANFCVTEALKSDLAEKGIEAVVLYDRPPSCYRSISSEERCQFLTSLCKDYPCFRTNEEDESSIFASSSSVMKSVRPALLVSSTSWTEDEDFSILLDALDMCDAVFSQDTNNDLPKIICVITGKGPMKEFYESKIHSTNFKNIRFCFPWLSAEDYSKMLASADVGVCLHTSSSGLDLPMKVVDMLGCKLPVLAYNYKCIDESVKKGINGYVFATSEQLSQQLQMLLVPPTSFELEFLRTNLKKSNMDRWEIAWKRNALPLFNVELKQENDH